MYCGKCGQELREDSRFCLSCGSETGSDDSTRAIETEESNAMAGGLSMQNKPANPGVSKPTNSPGSGRKKIIIGTLLAILLAIGGFMGWQKLGAESRVQDKLDLAVKYLSENDYDKAILAFNDAIKIDPKEVKAYQGLARVYTIKGDYDNAKSTYDKGLTSVAQEKKPTLQLGLAGMYIDQGQLDKAEQAFQELNSGNKECLETYWGLAMVYQKKGDNAKAEGILRKAIENNPSEYRAYNTLALFLKQNNKSDDAFNNLVKSLSLEINQQEAYLVLNDIYKGRWNDLQPKLSSVSDQQLAAMLQFYSHYASGDNQKAIDIYREKLVQQNKNQKARIMAAFVMARLGDNNGAESIITQLTKEQLNEWLLSDIAAYYQAINNADKAKEYAIKALQANPTNLDAIVLLQRLNAADTKIYTAQALLYNWKPVVKVKEELQTAGQTDQTVAVEKKEEIKLTPDYFIPDISKKYVWGQTKIDYWSKKGEKYWVGHDYINAENYEEEYIIQGDSVLWTNDLEGGSDLTVKTGRRVVLAPVGPGESWTNSYTLTTAYQKSYKETYTFIGMEEINCMGKPTRAAHIHISGDYAFHSVTDIWLVKGYGVVKAIVEMGGKKYPEELTGVVPK